MQEAGGWPIQGAEPRAGVRPAALFALVLLIATAGLVYELAMAAVASYLLGDSVTQFSLVIGVYLSAPISRASSSLTSRCASWTSSSPPR